MLRRRMFAFRLPRALVTHRRKIQDAIKELVHRVQQVDLAKQVNWFCEQSFRQHKLPQVLFRRANGPEQVTVGHTLPGTLHPKPNISLFKLRFWRVQQPITEIAIYLVGASSKRSEER